MKLYRVNEGAADALVYIQAESMTQAIGIWKEHFRQVEDPHDVALQSDKPTVLTSEAGDAIVWGT
jgi:hypothetical protein